jgi:hypothetical protein
MDDVVTEGHDSMDKGYEPPSLTSLGSVHELTQARHGPKSYGGSDGFSFMGFPVTNAS